MKKNKIYRKNTSLLNSSNPRFGNETGQSLVLIALMMVGLVAFLGLVIDGGRDYAARRQSQNASDAAAFAGARTMTVRANNSASEEQNVLNAINRFALDDGIATATDIQGYFLDSSNNQVGAQIGLNGGIPGSATGVRVYTTIRFQPFIISVVTGGGDVSTRTVAATQTGVAGSMDGLMPMTLLVQNFNYNQNYQLFGNRSGQGAFQWLSYDCESSNTDLVSYLSLPATKTSGTVVADPTDTYMTPDSTHWVCNGPGVENSNAVNDALTDWINLSDPKQRYWTIPIYDFTAASGSNLEYHIVQFAVFEFDGWNFNGSNKFVQGKFVRYGRLGHVDNPGSCNTNGANICGISLFQ